jgi:hypothetical protein
MNALKHFYHEDSIQVGNHEVHWIKEIHGIDDLPAGLDGNRLLTLELPAIPIVAAGIKVGLREFYLCYSPEKSLLFIVETEMAKRVETKYRPQYGQNDNYDSTTATQRIVWIYKPDSPRAKDPVIANHLKEYLP